MIPRLFLSICFLVAVGWLIAVPDWEPALTAMTTGGAAFAAWWNREQKRASTQSLPTITLEGMGHILELVADETATPRSMKLTGKGKIHKFRFPPSSRVSIEITGLGHIISSPREVLNHADIVDNGVATLFTEDEELAVPPPETVIHGKPRMPDKSA